ncbi:hypothetical protein BSIN_0780 [Burkholderia singularis]|uniref:Uncharacterized protein n=1 Tax=Burkholderia singularis TaxID=1503053 RepID=A0A238H9J2_9BURK|nr:hypothetical protein BSIN_0780 [Burkholderia singularis]
MPDAGSPDFGVIVARTGEYRDSRDSGRWWRLPGLPRVTAARLTVCVVGYRHRRAGFAAAWLSRDVPKRARCAALLALRRHARVH